jgi:glycerophosphoryl diester phosphodiesterase
VPQLQFPELIAHRGASFDAPENTLAAIRLAWQQNADAVEIDVHLTRDGAIVAMHDDNTRRTAGLDAKIAEQTLAQLKALDAGSWKDAAFAGERIPTLDEILAELPTGKRLVVEVKDARSEIVPALQSVIAQSGVLPAQLVLICFDYAQVTRLKAALPQVGVLLLHGASTPPTFDELAALCRDAKLDGLDLHFAYPLVESDIAQMRAAGLQWMVWTVDDADTARLLVAAGVDGITTNRPAWLREQLQTS